MLRLVVLMGKPNTMPTRTWTSIVDVYKACHGAIADNGRDFGVKLNSTLSEDAISGWFSG